VTELAPFTYDELTQEIEDFAGRSSSPASKTAWSELAQVVKSVAGTPSSLDDIDPTVDSQTWWLIQVAISGVRGVPEESLTLDFSPTPGITVIHGPNGSGKSSIADAIDIALHQDMQTSVKRIDGTGGKAPIWEPTFLHKGEALGTARVTLRSNLGQDLSLELGIGQSDILNPKVTLIDAAGTAVPASIGAAWRAGLAAYNPVYSYATWEQHIHLAQDLQRYLVRMLALGGCFGRLASEIDLRSQESAAAEKTIKISSTSASTELRQLERLHSKQSNIQTDVDVSQDPDAWWLALGFPPGPPDNPTGYGAIEISALNDASRSLRRLAIELQEAAVINPGVVHALDLLSQASILASPEGVCPVCGSTTSWRVHLSEILQTNRSLVDSIAAWIAPLNNFSREVNDTVERLIAASPSPTPAVFVSIRDLSQQLASGRCLGNPSAPTTIDLTLQILDGLDSEAFTQSAAIAVARSSEDAAWQLAQSQAVYVFYQAWSDNRTQAMEADRWRGVVKCLKDLEKKLSLRRQDALVAAANRTVSELFRDVGLKISTLKVQTIQASIVLEDEAGRELELGMLSAGQRNAVLLAPALAVAGGGPFGFLVIDDPIHAFDELRVDQIARQLIQVSNDRRVIVLTHDERLREHLLASPGDVDSRSIQRRNDSGRIEVRTVGPMWSVLLEDARSLFDVASTPDEIRALTTTIRGLCRQSLDNCLRLLVTREAISAKVDPALWLSELDGRGVDTTAQRMATAERLVSPTAAQRLRTATTMAAGLLQDWNEAAHGNPPKSAVTVEEIKLARQACKEVARA